MLELLTPGQMAVADKTAIDGGVAGIDLMENAGAAVVEILNSDFPDASRILFLCGTGNNGGDGFVAARRLGGQREVAVHVTGDIERITGDAKLAFDALDKETLVSGGPDFSGYDLIVDALFGAGLDRPITGAHENLIKSVNDSGVPVLSVDLPSGIDGASGQVMGCAFEASSTVTFFRCKPGHFLVPGRGHCGKLHCRQIGIAEEVLNTSGVAAFRNQPGLWLDRFPIPQISGHKYHRGHSLVLSGPIMSTGASRLAADAALRVGSGLVTIASPADAVSIHASRLTSVMLCQADSPDEIRSILSDRRFNCVALGPGLPPDRSTVSMVEAVLGMDLSVVLDAGALSAFQNRADELFAMISGSGSTVVLTPHQGEFARLFPMEGKLSSKLDGAKAAAEKCGATVLFKGPDTVVASPGGQSSVADNAPPWLATAGSGDVLTGCVAGLMAQGMPSFEAASAAVWLHGDAADKLGPGLVSSDLDEGLRKSIGDLVASRHKP